MSLHQIAQAVQSRGRGDDSVLIHMTPKEVGGLQALAMANGGSLTTNPDTGLPEAGFLSSLLPTLIGAGLSVASGGTLTPLMAAGLVGGGTALATGNIQKGLMAGLGAYGGAGLGSGLVGAGAGAAQQAAMQGVAPQAVAGQAATSAANALPAFDPIAGTMVNEGMVGGAANAQAQAAAQATANAQSLAAIEGTKDFLAKPWYEKLGSGIESLGTESGRDMALQSMGGGKKALQFGIAAAAPMLSSSMQPTTTAPPSSGPNPYSYTYDPGRVADPEAGYTGAASGERTYFRPSFTRLAKGGLASGGFVVPADVVSMLGEGSTDAGIRALRAKFGEVKAIKGPGTGQSDSIKTTIEGRQPARVADGEAYIPPEVVQQHGGAKKFYAMLSKVRAASQGHTKQQRRVNPDRVMA